ncbi:thiopurine S-methyltransferase [Cocleimonas flava]|uniref:Thiopurine S-methyltransferase n=1 Tax=Cocleimonas flava TaxID=634765 RepID=A0A4R1F3R6_9GAMM|nr:thiopurine S-methyltransferase [Cocleimonas flava]TCJ88443.1 thiopurine S-methyltransferase [Cocleimonas flava]
MEADFWHERWSKNEIGFHENEVNPLLVKHIKDLNLPEGSRIFLPLCGKTRDIAWLHSKGYKVVGIELSEHAVKQLFTELLGDEKLQPEVTQIDQHTLYTFENIEVYVGDFFKLSKQQLGKIDAVYDRASLVALPDTMRTQYAQHLLEITQGVPQLLITLEYDQSVIKGPPFSISDAMIKNYYQNDFNITELERISEKLKGKVDADNVVWQLLPKR